MSMRPLRWARPPWSFRLASFLNRNGVRGGYRLLNVADRLHWLDCCVRYELTPRISFGVPLYRPETRWSRRDVLGYEKRLVECLAERLSAWPGPVRLLDCGADIGTLSALLASRLHRLVEVHAFEPNPVAFQMLEENLRMLPCAGHAHQAALSDFAGRGVLSSSTRDKSEHARYLAPVTEGRGHFDVMRIDDLELSRDATLGLKIDVEGGELSVLRGAKQTLVGTPHWVVAFEAHREVCERTGIDPCEILRWLQSVRPAEFVVAERPDLTIDTAWPFFKQVSNPRVVNVVCWTSGD